MTRSKFLGIATNEILEDILEELKAIRSEVACIPKEPLEGA